LTYQITTKSNFCRISDWKSRRSALFYIIQKTSRINI